MDRIIVPEDQIHAGADVDAESHRLVPVGDQYVPWVQGRLPKERTENYAEFALMPSGAYSKFANNAHRIKVDLTTVFTNSRSEHDWKGYDDTKPSGTTKIHFNDRPVGTVHAWSGDILRHLLAVEKYVSDLRNLPFGGWWTDEELAKEVGRQVDYDGYPGVIADVMNTIGQGEITIYCPTWPDDGYDRGGMLRTSLTYDKINWYPNMSEMKGRPTVDASDPYVGPEYVEEDDGWVV